MKKTFILLISLSFIACTEPSNQKAPDSALPRAVKVDSDINCPIPESTWRGYEPALNAWLTASESIFVGTIKSVSQVNAPVYHKYSDETGTHDLGIIEAKDCTGYLEQAIRFEFENVETLYGKKLPSTLSIQSSYQNAHGYLTAVYSEKGELLDYKKNPVYTPGARIGASVHIDDSGMAHWKYRQFEIINNQVHLQEIDKSNYQCTEIPHVAGIPDNLDGISYDEFLSALHSEAAKAPLTSDQQASLQRFHQPWAESFVTGEASRAHRTTCSSSKPTNTNEANNAAP